MDKQFTLSVSRRTLKMALVMAVVMAVLAPVAVIAAGGTFTDDDTSIFEQDIEWMATNGITSGCGIDLFCPDDNVTRGQMAAFMKRLATKKVVDAATAITADDAGTLDGLAPTYYDNPAWGAACEGGNCPAGAGLTMINVLELPVTAPHDGYLTIGSSFQGTQPGSFDILQTWVVMDPTSECGGWFFVPTQSLAGSYTAIILDGNVTIGTNSSTIVTPVTAGDHTLQLCVLGADTVASNQGSLTATFSSSGSSDVVTGAPSPEYIDLLEQSFGAVNAIN